VRFGQERVQKTRRPESSSKKQTEADTAAQETETAAADDQRAKKTRDRVGKTIHHTDVVLAGIDRVI
jgi:hypothetical protein